MARIAVLPKDIRSGDHIDQMNRNLDVVPVEVAEVEKVRVDRRTAYRVHFVGAHESMVLTPGKTVEVDR